MASTWSTGGLNLRLMTTGENDNTWGDQTNDNLKRLENKITGYAAVTLSGTTHTLTFTDNPTSYTDEDGRNFVLNFGGSPGGTCTVTIPARETVYLVLNNTADSNTITLTTGSGTTFNVPAGKDAFVYSDGTNVYNAMADAIFSTITGDGSALTGVLHDVVDDTTPQLGGSLDTNGNDINFDDSDKAQFGASNDLQIYHDGTHSYIKEVNAGVNNHLFVQADNMILENTDGSNYFRALGGGAVQLYHNGSEKIATTSTGVDVTGTVVSDGLTVAGNVSIDGGTIKLDGNYPDGTDNVALGNTALDSIITGGNYNTAIGALAGTAITTGDENTLIGSRSGDAITTGSSNTAVGQASLGTNITGNYNTAIGVSALSLNTTSNNTAVGYQALQSNTTGYQNEAFGLQSLNSNTTGGTNSAFGYQTLFANTTGASNVAFGFRTLDANTTGNYNTALGYSSLTNNTTASNNTAVGYQSLLANTSGTQNVAVGTSALETNTTANNNTAIGYLCLDANTTASNNTGVGAYTLTNNTTGVFNTALGAGALQLNTTASNNTGIGYQALYANTGASNTAIGHQAGKNKTSGDNNVYVGDNTFGSPGVTGSHNTVVGSGAGYSATGANYNAILGSGAMLSLSTGSNNVAVGYQALSANTTGIRNVAVGDIAGNGITTGSENVLIGRNSGDGLTTSSNNTFVGDSCGYLVTSGSKNTILGRYNGNQGGLNITTSSNNIVLSDGDGNPRVHVDTNGMTTFEKSVLLEEGTLTDGATISWDVRNDPVAKVTLGGNRTLSAPSNAAGSGQFISLLVNQDGTGSRTLTWNAIYEFKDDTAPTLTTTASRGDLFVFRYNGSKWLEVGRNLNLVLS